MHDEMAYIASRYGWGGDSLVGFATADRRHHTYLIGKSGTGKTTLLRNLIAQDLWSNRGVGVIDPHGDLARDILDIIPPWRTSQVVYVNPADYEHPVGLNLLASVPADERHLVVSGVVGALKSIWRDSWGPRTEYLLSAAVAAVLDTERETLLGVQRMLVDGRYRQWVVRQVKDPMVRSFWVNEFERYDERFRREAVAPIQNKVGQLLMAAPLRNMLGQVRSGFDPSFLMDNGRIFIANLAKGSLGEDKANLLGALLVTQFQLAAMARNRMPEESRKDFFLAIDEFHNFSTDSFAGMLAEIRKYRLSLTLAHQYTAQLRDEVRNAVFGNVGTLASFRVGEADGMLLEREFGDGYKAKHFTNLGNYEVCVKMLCEGVQRAPFIAKALPVLPLPGDRREAVIRQSRERYAIPRKVVEQKIERWMG